MRHAPPDVLARLARRGRRSVALLFPHRDALRDRASDADWLNRILALARGAREKNAVKLDVYEVL